MKLTSKEALDLLGSAVKIKSGDWIEHSICVGSTAEKIAIALKVDSEYAKTLGYIHDIGKLFSNKEDNVLVHAVKGYEYIKEMGYGDDYAGICIKHSFLNHDINCLANDRDETDKEDKNYEFVKEYIKGEYLVYDKIICISDLMCTTKTLTLEKRLIDLLLRHGVYKNTHYHLEEAIKLKNYFDVLLKHNLYDLFPEIKENL